MTERCEYERMLDRASPQKLGDTRERHGLDLDDLVAVEVRLVGLRRADREKAVQVVIHDRRIRSHASELPPLGGRVAGLLDKLARRRALGVLARVDHATRDLEAYLFDADTVLAEKHDLVCGCEG